jgi:DNA-binding NtrC family response regulator
VLEVRLPPLRERIEDLPALFDFFLAEIAPDRTIQADGQTLKQLQSYLWPGNLRELRNVASFSITANGGANRIAASDLPDHLDSQLMSAEDSPAESLENALGDWIAAKFGTIEETSPLTYRDIADDLERRLIRQLLNRHDGKLARLATEMKANRTTLRKKLREQ